MPESVRASREGATGDGRSRNPSGSPVAPPHGAVHAGPLNALLVLGLMFLWALPWLPPAAATLADGQFPAASSFPANATTTAGADLAAGLVRMWRITPLPLGQEIAAVATARAGSVHPDQRVATALSDRLDVDAAAVRVLSVTGGDTATGVWRASTKRSLSLPAMSTGGSGGSAASATLRSPDTITTDEGLRLAWFEHRPALMHAAIQPLERPG